jgi:hypothetical protein
MPPATLSPAEQYRLLLENTILQGLSQLDEPPEEGVRSEMKFGRRIVSVRISPAGASSPQIRLSPCMLDCVQTLREAGGGPMTRPLLIEAMEAAGRVHGESTVAKALADLKAAGVLGNDGHHKGYYIPE